MHTITAFCRLDFCRLIQNSRWNIGVALLSLFAVFCAPARSQLTFFFYLYLSASFLFTMISMDEQEHSNYLCCMLPTSRHFVVLGRFALYFVLLTVLSCVYMILGYLSPATLPNDFVLQINLCYAMALIFTGVTQTLVYRLSYMTARIVGIVIFATLFSFISLLVDLLNALSIFPQTFLAFIVSGSGLVIFAVCLFIAQMLYVRKDIKD